MAGVLLSLLAARAAGAAPVETVRVLLAEEKGPLLIHGDGGGATSVAAMAGGLRVNGRSVGRQLVLASTDGLRFRGVRYAGRLVALRTARGVALVNHVPLESYVAGTILREAYARWGLEVLRAQAVVTRTYALYQALRRKGDAWDVTAGTSSQVYGGQSAAGAEALRAARDTVGQYLAYGGSPILAAFHSASGGITASAEEVWGKPLPYLARVSVEGEEASPDTSWSARITRAQLRRALAALGIRVGEVRQVIVEERSASGRARMLRVRGSAGSARVEGRHLRSALGERLVRSTRFEVRAVAGGFQLTGSGYGHGVGMSQWGARALVQRGASYRDVLAYFYPGATLQPAAGRAESGALAQAGGEL
jgi:stage II sporulation protein D